MGKVINFGGGNPVWKDLEGNKYKFEAIPLYKNSLTLTVNGQRRARIDKNGRLYSWGYGVDIVKTSYDIKINNGIAWEDRVFGAIYKHVITLTLTSTIDNGNETFSIAFQGLSDAIYQVFCIYSEVDTRIKVDKVSIDSNNSQITISRSDESGEEFKVHILLYVQ